MKKYIVILILLINVKVTAQEINLPQYVNHMADNPFIISPAYAGIGTELQVRLNGISQWIGVKESPDTQSLTVEARIADRFGGGIAIFNDKNGYTSQKGAKLSLASHLTLSNFHDSFLSFGLTYSFIQFENNVENPISFSSTSFGDPILNSRKPINSSNFDLSMLYRYERFAISANVSNLLDKDVKNFDTNEPKVLRRYSLYSSINYKVRNDVELEPSVFIEYFEATGRSRTDMNAKLRKRIGEGYIWGGVSYSFLNDQFFTPNSIAPLFGIKKENFYVSYGFSINPNRTLEFSYGTHMITLGFDYERRPSLARCTQKMMMF